VATNDPNKQVQETAKGRFYLLGNPQANDCSLDIRDARKKDQGTYFFRVERGDLKGSYALNQLFVQMAGKSQLQVGHRGRSLRLQGRAGMGKDWGSNMRGSWEEQDQCLLFSQDHTLDPPS
jgi:hypothetical protein